MKSKRFIRGTTLIIADRSAGISTVGYMCIAITWWLLGMLIAGWYPANTIPTIAFGSLYALGSILLVIMGILTTIYGRDVLDSVVFFGMSGLLFSFHVGHISSMLGEANFPGYYGWFALLWAIYFCYLWIAALSHIRGNVIRMLFLLFFWVGALIAAIGGWANSGGLEMLSGYLFLLGSITAFIMSATAIIAGINRGPLEEERISETPPPTAPPHSID